MNADHLERIGDFLAVRWDDGSESVIPQEILRQNCPCALCAGEPDVTGAVRRPAHPPKLGPGSFELVGMERIGAYAVALTWGDGHQTGIYTWDMLRRLGDAADAAG